MFPQHRQIHNYQLLAELISTQDIIERVTEFNTEMIMVVHDFIGTQTHTNKNYQWINDSEQLIKHLD